MKNIKSSSGVYEIREFKSRLQLWNVYDGYIEISLSDLDEIIELIQDCKNIHIKGES